MKTRTRRKRCRLRLKGIRKNLFLHLIHLLLLFLSER
jgi:hypothetical protein